jgi:hypothetical protein
MPYGFIILAIIAIGIIGVLGAPSHVNFNGLRTKAEASALAIYADGVVIAKNNYQIIEKQPLPLVGWRQALLDAGQPIPSTPGVTLRYGREAGEGNYFCFEPDVVTRTGYQRLIKAQEKLTGRTYVNESCGASNNMASGDVASAASLALTVYTGD